MTFSFLYLFLIKVVLTGNICLDIALKLRELQPPDLRLFVVRAIEKYVCTK
jgi:hypothetical protein